jgi:hypothetical protein
LSDEVWLYIIENNTLIDRHYLGGRWVTTTFPYGNYDMNTFLQMVETHIQKLKDGIDIGYADGWITLYATDEVDYDVIVEITAHPKANFQIKWE